MDSDHFRWTVGSGECMEPEYVAVWTLRFASTQMSQDEHACNLVSVSGR